MTLAPGHVLEGKYVITRQIAEGGTSAVFLGENKRIGKAVAVKILHPVMASLPDVVERFEREARILSRIRSTHVADVYDFGELPTGERFMVMEYLEGESLATMLEREHTLPARALSAIAVQILSALTAAHAAGVVHRDLKPENIIVTTRGTETVVKVVDFGISKCADVGESALRKTAADALMGTPLYMSPEQARGNTAAVDERTDIYALGVILYEATAGELPITGENVQDVLYRIAVEEPAPLESRIPTVDQALAEIVRRAMEKVPERRYGSAAEMLQAVEDWRALHVSASSLVPSEPGAAALSTAPVVLSSVASSSARTVTPPRMANADGVTAETPELPARPAGKRRGGSGRVTKALAVAAVLAAAVASVHHLRKVDARAHAHVVENAPVALAASPALQSATFLPSPAASVEETAPVVAAAAPAIRAATASPLAAGPAAGPRGHRPATALDAGKAVIASAATTVPPSAEPVGALEPRPAPRATAPASSTSGIRRAYRASFE